jgi:hypothetical protein
MEHQKLTERLGEKVKKVSRAVTGIVDDVKSRVKNSVEHRIVKPSREVVAEWKKEVDQFSQAIRDKDMSALSELMKRKNPSPDQHPMSGDPSIIMHRVNEDNLDENGVRLLAISLFVLREKPAWNPKKAIFKVLRGQQMDFSNLQTAKDEGETMHCWDVAAWVKELAAEYGIDGEIKTNEPMEPGSRLNDLTRPIQHAYFATEDHRVVDPMHGWEHGGYYKDERTYTAAYKAYSRAEQVGLKKDPHKRTPFKSTDLRAESFKLLNKSDDFGGVPEEIAKSALWSPIRRHSHGAMWNVFSSEESDYVLKVARKDKWDKGGDSYRRQKVDDFPMVISHLGEEFTLAHAVFEVGKDAELCILQKKLDMKEWEIISLKNINSVLKSGGEYVQVFKDNRGVIEDFVERVEKLYEEEGRMVDFMGENLAFRVVNGKLEIKLMDLDCFVKGRFLDKGRILKSQDFLRKLRE